MEEEKINELLVMLLMIKEIQNSISSKEIKIMNKLVNLGYNFNQHNI
jgi:hypothetical protein